MGLLAGRCQLLDTESAFKIGPLIRGIEASGKKVIKCNLGEPDFPLPKHISAEIKRQLDKDNVHYCDPQGILPLRKAIAKQISETRRLSITPDRVVVFPGAKPPIGLCQQVYVDHGEEIVYPSPGFPIYESFTRYVGSIARPLFLKEDKGFGLGAEDLEPLLSERTKLIYLNFPSNPTGGVASREQLTEIAELIQRKCPAEIRVYSDEVYENVLFDGRQHVSIASLPGMESRTIIASGVSKSYSWTGGRVGWAAFPTAAEAEIFKQMNINYFSCIPAYNQEGAREALESPLSDASIRTMVQAFQERRDVVVAGLNAIPGVRCQNPQGAFYVFPNIGGMCANLGAIDAYESLPADIRARTTPSTLVQMFLLFRYAVATMDRKSFGHLGTEGMHYLRLSIATGIDDLRVGLERFGKAAVDVDGFADFIKEGEHLY